MNISTFTQYRRSQIAELRPYLDGEVLNERVSISAADREAGSPKLGDMIARNPKNHEDQWLVAAKYFSDNFEPVGPMLAAQGEPTAWMAIHDSGRKDPNLWFKKPEPGRGWNLIPLFAAQPVAQTGVPEGYVLVPIKPTDGMLEAALRLQGNDAFLAKAPAVVSAFVKIYKAMLAAAPTPSKENSK